MLVFAALSGCGDGKPRAEQSSASPADTLAVDHRPESVPATDPSGRRAGAVEGNNGNNSDMNAGAADVVKRYYDAIARGRYDSAYVLWEGSGKASGQSLAQFKNGFAQTERTSAAIGDSVHVEGAAGSQYATVPVSVEAVTRAGKRQHFDGSYTLRRAMVDGATPEQRTWHIYSAQLIRN